MPKKSRWHVATKQFLEPNHPLIREQDRLQAEEVQAFIDESRTILGPIRVPHNMLPTRQPVTNIFKGDKL